MKGLLFLLFLSLAAACSPAGPADGQGTVDTPDDVVEVVSLYHPGVNWDDCSSSEEDHPCNIISFDHDNEEFDLYSQYGSLVVVDLSAMWCGPCNSAGAHAQEVQDLYIDEDLIYVTVLVEDSHANVPDLSDLEEWATAYGNTTSPVVAGSRTMLTSGGGTWDLTSWPTFFYLDRDLVIRDIDKGYNEQEVIYSIEWLLTL